MKNLAGVVECDETILKELEEAGITPCNLGEPTKNEVPYTVYGVLGGRPFDDETKGFMARHGLGISTMENFATFIFTRAWYYWSVQGYVPLAVAEELYADPVGQKDVRVDGHCACPPPSEWLVQHKVCGMDVVRRYHIDSQEGLNLFVAKMKEHGLV